MPGNERWELGVRVITSENYQYLPIGTFGWSGAYGTYFWIDQVNSIAGVYMKNSVFDGGSGTVTAANYETDVFNSLTYSCFLYSPDFFLFAKRSRGDRKTLGEYLIKMAVAAETKFLGYLANGILCQNNTIISFLETQFIYVVFWGSIIIFSHQSCKMGLRIIRQLNHRFNTYFKIFDFFNFVNCKRKR